MNRRGLLLGLGSVAATKPLVTTQKTLANPKQSIAKVVAKAVKPIEDYGEMQKAVTKEGGKIVNRSGFLKKVKNFLVKKATLQPKETISTGKKIVGSTAGALSNIDPMKVSKKAYLKERGLRKVPFEFLENFNRKLSSVSF